MPKLLSVLMSAIALLIGLGALPSLSYAISNEEAKTAESFVVAMEHGDHDDDDDEDEDDEDEDEDNDNDDDDEDDE